MYTSHTQTRDLPEIFREGGIFREAGAYLVRAECAFQYVAVCCIVLLHLEFSKRVAFFEKLACVSFVQGASEQEDDIVNHVAVCDVVEELRETTCGVYVCVGERER